MGLSNKLSCEAGSFSCHLDPHRFFQSEVLRLYFPTLELWIGQSVTWSTSCCLAGQLQPCPPHSTISHLAGSASRRLATSPPCSGCPSPPLLLFWMSVSSLSPWLSDFHTVRFSVSSGCFLFLNCCCPSFGCARRHSVSTYASVLAGSLRSSI